MVRLTQEQKESMAGMRERGLSYGQIALKFGCSPNAVAWHCLRLGADPPNARKLSGEIVGPLVMQRGNHVVRRFTAEDDATLQAMSASGKPLAEIARTLGRKHNSIIGRLMTLARRAERAGA